MRFTAWFLASLAIAALVSPASAELIVRRPFVPGVALFSQTSPAPDVRETADAFTITAATRIGQVSWLGSYSPGGPLPEETDFLIRFYASSSLGLTPATIAFSESAVVAPAVDTRINDPSDVYAYSATISVALMPGTYWIAILENDPATTSFNWRWARSLPGDHSAQRSSGEWSLVPIGDRCFNLYSIPEPSTYVMAAMGFVALLFVRRRKVR